jgi:hypothetical protein
MLRMDKKASKEDRLKRIEEVLLDVLKSSLIQYFSYLKLKFFI